MLHFQSYYILSLIQKCLSSNPQRVGDAGDRNDMQAVAVSLAVSQEASD